jgi:hypothetical protein
MEKISPAIMAAIKATERLVYNRGTLGEAVAAWKPFQANAATLRFQGGMAIVSLLALTNMYAQTIAVFDRGPRRTKEQEDLKAIMKAAIALILGKVGAPDPVEADNVLPFGIERSVPNGDRD